MLSSLTITQASEKLRNKEISSVELTKDCIAAMEKKDATLNAVVYRNFESALSEAKKFDAKKSPKSPLAGIPYLAKDVFCEKGVPTTAASNILRVKDYLPPYDSTTTKRLKAAGAISLGKTNTDEFTMGSSTETSCYGVTKCPWDVTRVAGGSSGGSAAAVAADECIFALGTDTGGSIRQPASFCGCVGLKVTYGRTSRFGVMSMASSLDTIGAFGKTVEDAALVLQAIAGRDPLDGTTSDVPVPDYHAVLGKGVKGLKIGLPKEYFIEGMDPEVEKAVRAAAQSLERLGATVIDVSLPHTAYAIATYYVLCPSEVSSNMARYDGVRYGRAVRDPKNLIDLYERVRSEGFGPEVKRRIMVGTFALSAGYYDAYYRKAQKVRTLVKKDFEDAFKKVDLLLTPTAPTPAFTIGAHADDPVQMYLEDACTIPASLAGVPGISLPCGFTGPRAGMPSLPLGMQLLGPHFREDVLFQVGHAYQQQTDWHTKKPGL
ncbi:MAG: Asp-tRNA(Asn)/Glu-tRNA(Gln) amidotransferase subunit GatA [Candidatus Peribacteraceae bacterium]